MWVLRQKERLKFCLFAVDLPSYYILVIFCFLHLTCAFTPHFSLPLPLLCFSYRFTTILPFLSTFSVTRLRTPTTALNWSWSGMYRAHSFSVYHWLWLLAGHCTLCQTVKSEWHPPDYIHQHDFMCLPPDKSSWLTKAACTYAPENYFCRSVMFVRCNAIVKG